MKAATFGRTDIANKSGKSGSPGPKRDSNVATGTSSGGKTLKLREGQVTRSSGPAWKSKDGN